MTKQEAKERIEKLKKEINHHRYLYHVLDKQEISDAALDSLKHELAKLEQQYPEFITPDSPTQRVGGKPLAKFEKVEHKTRMLSLEDAFTEEEMKEWRGRIQKIAAGQKLDFFSELKIDGFAISLEYKNKVFFRGSTRGDGKIGEDVTQNLKTIESIPLNLRIPKEEEMRDFSAELRETIRKIAQKREIEIRGEVYMTKKAFEDVNAERKKMGEPLYANPRNTAAGSIRQLDPKIAASRRLDFLAYDITTDVGQKTHEEEHKICKLFGFKTLSAAKYCKDIGEVMDFWEEIAKKREKLPHQIDGIVVTVNNNKTFQYLGVAGKAPRGSIAFKFPGRETTTRVKDIIVQVGRTGTLTPVAALEPVNIGGVIVTRATLHNEDEIKRLGIKIGDTVIVQRAGDVIPDIVKVLVNLRTGREKSFKMPVKCPVCGGKVVRIKGEAAHRCVNEKCPAKHLENLYHFASKKAFNINGLGPKIIDQLVEQGLISDAADLFILKEGDLVPLERFAEKSAGNLVSAIQKSKKIDLARFIYALGVRHVGEESSFDLAEHFGSVEKLKDASIEELLKVEDIGGVAAKSIYDWFRDSHNLKFLGKLKKVGVWPVAQVARIKRQPLKGKIFVLTGELENMTRDEAKSAIRKLGGDVSGSVSKKTDYVLLGENSGSKYDKAKELGVKIIHEKEFLNLISRNT